MMAGEEYTVNRGLVMEGFKQANPELVHQRPCYMCEPKMEIPKPPVHMCELGIGSHRLEVLIRKPGRDNV